MLPVAVDAMGGDRAPAEIVAGARQAADELGVPVVLVGDSARIGDTLGLDVIPASEVIEMHDDPAQGVRRKKDSSLVRAAEAVRDGRASAMVSAGNTGATMASALLRMGRLPGVARPAIATPLPVPGGTPTVLLDCGANADCSAAWLHQFAQMGGAFFRARYGTGGARVGILSIGEEDTKGSVLVKEARTLIAADPSIDFIGNVEGRDILTHDVDVIVTDGFTGNVTLKTLEGAIKTISALVIEALATTSAADEAIGALLPIAAELHPDTTGGAMLLGVDGVCIISHGSSSATAIVNAVKVARDMVEGDLVAAVARSVIPVD